MAADHVKQSHEALEHVDLPDSATRASQGALEVVHETPPSVGLRETQAAAEVVQYPPNSVWASQLCLEVLFPADGFEPPTPTPGRRNHSFYGSMWQSTGHGFNASFND